MFFLLLLLLLLRLRLLRLLRLLFFFHHRRDSNRFQFKWPLFSTLGVPSLFFSIVIFF